ncbi:unnamed protein product [Effrenium voratum]|nr:unnamed protein product [Effrenium voratum]
MWLRSCGNRRWIGIWLCFLDVAKASSLGCVVRVGNASDDLHAFAAAAQTWGVKCRWFVGLAPTPAVADMGRRLVNGTKARVLTLEGASTPLEVLLRSYQLKGAFPGGPPRLACALADAFMFLVVENLMKAIEEAGLHDAHLFSLLCGSRLLCQTAAAGTALSELPLSIASQRLQERAMRLGPACGRRPEEACAEAIRSQRTLYPPAIHASGAAGHRSLFSALYLAWPATSWGCRREYPVAIPDAVRPFGQRKLAVAVLIGSLLRSPASTILLLGRLFVEEVDYQVFVYTAPIAQSRACADALAVLVGEWVSAKLKVASVRDSLEEQYFQSVVGTRHMRQWYKLRAAYAMMEEQERMQGWKYDLVPEARR